jgi:hypothetical protein
MSQNVNLLGPAFRKQRQVVTLATLVQCLVVTLVALGGYHYYLQQQVNGLTAELASSEALLNSQRNFLQKKGAAGAAKPDGQLDADIARYETELKLARESVEALKGGAFGNQNGFAEYLRAFSRQSVNGLWLTGFTIAGGGELEIHGRVVSPDLLPSYIQRLNQEQVLAGRSFAKLEMSRPKVEAAPNVDAKSKDAGKDAGKDAKKAPRVPRFLEFSLATTDTPKPEKTQ